MAKQIHHSPEAPEAYYKRRREEISTMLNGYKGNFAELLPGFINAERFIAISLNAISANPELIKCTNLSIVAALMACAELGLIPDSSIMGEIFLSPEFDDKKREFYCTFIVGYKGLCALAMRTGQVKGIEARAVYSRQTVTTEPNIEDGDYFYYEYGLNEDLKHIPCGQIHQDQITHFYAIVKFVNGGNVFGVFPRAKIDQIRDESKNYKFAPKKEETLWFKNYPDMGIKTVLRAIMKFVPMSTELKRALALDEAAEFGKQKPASDYIGMLGGQLAEEAVSEVVAHQQDKANDKRTARVHTTAKKAQAATSQAKDFAPNKGQGKKK